MVYTPSFPSAPGTVTQVRECGAELTYLAKRTGVTVFLIGHVTKEGAIAGPRVLEHLVDTVLYFEGERFHAYRILRAVKNRFGSTNEIGVFEMRELGLVPVQNPSGFFLSQRSRQGSGSVVVPCMEGTRAFLVEIQALISRANFGVPERKVSGADYNRVCMLLAVLEKRAGLMLGGQDAFVNVVGGVHVDEPAADLGIALAMASSFRDKRLPDDLVVLGEVGLAGEVRGVGKVEARIKEAQKLGFRRVLLPRDNEFPKSLAGVAPRHVSTLAEAMDEMV
jgi:DNA repair protein RadA/Sms